jgi:hypothetical protein
MKKQLKSITGLRLTIDDWSKQNYPLPEIPAYVQSRHLRRRAKYKYKDGTAIIDLKNGWYALSYRNGILMLCVLPF